MKRIASIACRPLVEAREHFQNHSGSLRGYWHEFEDGARVYVVWTYNQPLFAYDEQSRQWFGNEHHYSRTSSKHRTLAHPYAHDMQWRDRQTMIEIANNGLVGAVRKKFREAA